MHARNVYVNMYRCKIPSRGSRSSLVFVGLLSFFFHFPLLLAVGRFSIFSSLAFFKPVALVCCPLVVVAVVAVVVAVVVVVAVSSSFSFFGSRPVVLGLFGFRVVFFVLFCFCGYHRRTRLQKKRGKGGVAEERKNDGKKHPNEKEKKRKQSIALIVCVCVCVCVCGVRFAKTLVFFLCGSVSFPTRFLSFSHLSVSFIFLFFSTQFRKSKYGSDYHDGETGLVTVFAPCFANFRGEIVQKPQTPPPFHCFGFPFAFRLFLSQKKIETNPEKPNNKQTANLKAKKKKRKKNQRKIGIFVNFFSGFELVC